MKLCRGQLGRFRTLPQEELLHLRRADDIGRRQQSPPELGGAALVAGLLQTGVFAYDAAFADIRNEDGFVAEARQARDLGFIGKSCIHPRQIALANAAFRPDDEEIAQSLRIVAAARTAQAEGTGAFVVDGRMIDAPFVRRAEAVVALAARLGLATLQE